ncbi:plasmid stabilization protein [Bosea sp. AAP35]|uniref:type II toxin-antitoxin system RelE/ParE family toxin n=1 Tax=Bosea sp. AAP35 TaxID=1523417 RepID=UPI0006B99AF8|nr:type II toxin-antitoxin system RelE/ParE family toxin [Bosea sp. AAP35]KPF68830.1 plasmid stabilization protein [Bosea sp. AAP35]
MADFALTKRAEADLYDLALFGYERFGEAQAEAYLAELDHVFKLLAGQPRMGRQAETIAPGVRRHDHGSHVILYEEAPSGVRILAIVHASSVRRLSL